MPRSTPPDPVPEALERGSTRGRLTLAAVTLGSGVALLDGTVVNVALRRIGTDLHASLDQLQWVVNGYLLALASLILVGGSLGDRLGRRRVYLVGVGAFAVSSLLCAVAGSPVQLVVFRVVQGVAAAMFVPGGLALIQSSFRRSDRAGAIGVWTGASGIAAAAGPVVGGLLLAHGGWRWIFLVNLPLCVLVVVLGTCIPESRDDVDEGRFDVRGAVLAVVMLGASTYALTEWRTLSTPWLVAWVLLAVGAVVAFALLERHPGALVPMELFASRVFTAANLMTLLVYGALGALLFFLVLQLQVVVGESPLRAGSSTVPLTMVMLLLSSRAARWGARVGPRLPLTIGPVLCAVGALLLSRVDHGAVYARDVLPGILVFASGLVLLVSPLTASVLAAAPDHHAGVASGVNNAVARAGSLLSVAALPALVGLSGRDYADPVVLAAAYRHALWVCALLLLLGAAVSWRGLRGTTPLVEGTP